MWIQTWSTFGGGQGRVGTNVASHRNKTDQQTRQTNFLQSTHRPPLRSGHTSNHQGFSLTSMSLEVAGKGRGVTIRDRWLRVRSSAAEGLSCTNIKLPLSTRRIAPHGKWNTGEPNHKYTAHQEAWPCPRRKHAKARNHSTAVNQPTPCWNPSHSSHLNVDKWADTVANGLTSWPLTAS